ncbi:MAG: multicopper oxidase domain-containing protein [Deltaproteobacteria bacterium]|nr:multicopper oxidase domain-containing protein [Deltaproteobacteria bacterium]
MKDFKNGALFRLRHWFICISLILTVPSISGAQVKEFTLTVTEGEIELKGVKFPVWTYNNEFPGPVIRVKEGDTVRIKLRNMSGAKHGMFFHGLRVDNRIALQEQVPVDPGYEYVYEFEAQPAGTHLYHCSWKMAEHLNRGMFGLFIVEAKEEKGFDREFAYVISDWNSRADSGGHGQGHPANIMDNDITTINNKAVTAHAPQVMDAKDGERVRVRIANIGYLPHKLRFPKGFLVTHEDGYPISEPKTQETLTIYPGKSHDISIAAVEGKWPLYHNVERPSAAEKGGAEASGHGHDGQKYDVKKIQEDTSLNEEIGLVLDVKGKVK